MATRVDPRNAAESQCSSGASRTSPASIRGRPRGRELIQQPMRVRIPGGGLHQSARVVARTIEAAEVAIRGGERDQQIAIGRPPRQRRLEHCERSFRRAGR